MGQKRRQTITVRPGTIPETDTTDLSAIQWVDGNHYRFDVFGNPTKVGGWSSYSLDKTINGCPRMLVTYEASDNKYKIVGTHSHLYAVLFSEVFNITPLVTSSTAIANSIDSDFTTLGTDPIATTSGSAEVTITQTAHGYSANDTITMAGATATNGIPAIELNALQTISTVTTNTYTFTVSTSATSTGSGGGAAVTVGSGYLTIAHTAHGFAEGDRIKIESATAVAGIAAGTINAEHILTSVDTNEYMIQVGTHATSSVTGGGGASTVMYGQIAAGNCDATNPSGWGVGYWNFGEWGVSQVDTSTTTSPTIWHSALFGTKLLLCQGQESGIYEWPGDTATAPTLVTNAPTDVNWMYVSNNTVVALGADNNFRTCDQNSETTWTPAPTNDATDRDVHGADTFFSALTLRGVDLGFTENGQVWAFRYIGGDFIWDTGLMISRNQGVIAPKARIEYNGYAWWLGNDGLFRSDGTSVETIPLPISRYLFDLSSSSRINFDQRYKIFAQVIKKFDEIRFYYPSGTSTEIDRYFGFNANKPTELILGQLDRTAAEETAQLFRYPIAMKSNGTMYDHESGTDDDGSALSWNIVSNYGMLGEGDNMFVINSMTPDSVQVGNVDVTIYTKEHPQSSNEATHGSYEVTATTNRIGLRARGRQRKVKFSGDSLGESWAMGRWIEEVTIGGRRG